MYILSGHNFYYRIEEPSKGYSSQPDDSDDGNDRALLIACVFISLAFNILFLIIIGFAFKKNRALVKSNRQLVTRDGLHYSRVNDRMDIDEVNVNTNDESSTSSSNSSSPSPVNDNNDDEPMIEL